MKIFINESDRQNPHRIALTNLAKFLEVKNYDQLDNNELMRELDKRSSSLIPLLKAYLTAYDKWFQFYKERKKVEDKQNIDYQLTPDEHAELGKLIKNREQTLNSLQERFDALQFELFKKRNGLENVDGILD